MIKKSDLLYKLKKAAQNEESLVLLLSSHLILAINQSMLGDEVKNEIKEMLQTLKDESIIHEGMINGLIISISKSSNDVY